MAKQKRKRVTVSRNVYYNSPINPKTGKVFYIDYMLNGTKYRMKMGCEKDGVKEYSVTKKRIKLCKAIEDKEVTTKSQADAYFNTPKHITLNEAFEMYIGWAENNKKTWKNDLRLYKSRIEPKFGNSELGKITLHSLEEFRVELRRTKKIIGDKTKTLSEASVKYYLILIRQIINKMIVWGEFNKENPFKYFKMHKINNKKREYLTKPECRRLLESIENYHDRKMANIIKFAFFTGMRKDEIFSLQWKDVYFDFGFIVIRDGKNGDDDEYHLNKTALEILKEQKFYNLKSEYVFPNRYGKKLQECRGTWENIKKAAAIIKPFRFHGLRHNFATQLAKLPEITPFELMKIMRHKNIDTTLRYIELANSSVKNTACAFEQAIL